MIDKNTGIWSLDLAKKAHKFDPILAGAIMVHYKDHVTSVTDLGCGPGYYVAMFHALWDHVDGYEGTSDIWEIWRDTSVRSGFDLSSECVFDYFKNENEITKKYDLVTCLEVMEHIPIIKEQIALDNISLLTKKYLVLSWAIPGQGGKGHVNERCNKYVIQQMLKRGFLLDKKATLFLSFYTSLPWFRRSLLAFKKR